MQHLHAKTWHVACAMVQLYKAHAVTCSTQEQFEKVSLLALCRKNLALQPGRLSLGCLGCNTRLQVPQADQALKKGAEGKRVLHSNSTPLLYHNEPAAAGKLAIFADSAYCSEQRWTHADCQQHLHFVAVLNWTWSSRQGWQRMLWQVRMLRVD